MRAELRTRVRVCIGAVCLVMLGCAEEPPADAGSLVDGDDASVDAAEGASPCAERESVVEGFRLGLEQQGIGGRLVARLVDARPSPPQKYLNDWTLDFLDADRNPLEDVTITSARSFMPVHGHDGTFPPVITPLEEPGRFEVADLNLWMRGPWQIELNVESATAGADYIEIHVCIEE